MRRSHQPVAAAAILIVGVAICASGCYAQLAGGGGELDEDPRETLPRTPSVDVEVERVGLEGFAAPDGPTVIGYRLENRGPARRVILELAEWPPPEHVPWGFTVTANTAPLELELGPGESRSGQWILPQFAGYQSLQGGAGSELLVLARDAGGAIVGAATMPEINHSYWPVVVVAGDPDTGLAIQEAVHRADLGQGAYARRHQVALLLADLPDLWYEYGGAGSVILARPWSDLPAGARTALRRHVAYGGVLHILPEHCPDWRSAEPSAAATPGLLPSRYGAGRVFVEPGGSSAEPGGREAWLARTIPGQDHALPGWNAVNPPLTLSYVMPDAWLLVALILLIVALVGPVAHLVLVRLRKREWSWVAVPALSIALAGCTYAVASSVKGEESAVEVHHLIQSFGDAPEAAVSTAIRIQSAEAGLRSIRVRGDQPRASFMSYAPFGNDIDPRKVSVTEDSVEIRDIPMHRFSSHDLVLTAPGEPRRVLVETAGDDGVRIVNHTSGALTDLYLERAGGWVRLADRLEPGETLERGRLGPGVPEHELTADEPESIESFFLRGILGAAISRRHTAAPRDFALVAGCSAEGLIDVVMTPAPQVEEVRATCAWLVTPPDRQPAGGAP
jgi:hypothetical protein